MIIYDYRQDNSLSSIIFVIMTIICLIVLSFLVIYSFRAIRKEDIQNEEMVATTLVFFAGILVVAILLVFFSWRACLLIKFDITCNSGNYESIVGSMEIVSVVRNDYRDSEQYDVEFIVDGMHFNNLISFSNTEKKLITENTDKLVEVRYSFIGKNVVIYQIVICEN